MSRSLPGIDNVFVNFSEKTYRVGLRAQANFSAQTFKPAHKARAGQRAALSV